MADQIKRNVTTADVAGLNLAPTFANKFNITVNPLFTRIAFGEFVAGDQERDVYYHTVITMPTLDATQLGQLVTAVIDNNPAAKELQRIVLSQLLAPASGAPTTTAVTTPRG